MFKIFLIQLEAEFLLMREEIKRYWLNNLVGAFVDLVYFYAIFVAVQNLAPGETLSGTSSLVLMYAVLQLVLVFTQRFLSPLIKKPFGGHWNTLPWPEGGFSTSSFFV